MNKTISVPSGGSAFEWNVRTAANKRGMHFEVDAKDLVGKPDIVFRREKLVVFLDGCFWHGCEAHWQLPRKNSQCWLKSRETSIARDAKVSEQLCSMGWTVLRFWEHEEVRQICNHISTIRSELQDKQQIESLQTA